MYQVAEVAVTVKRSRSAVGAADISAATLHKVTSLRQVQKYRHHLESSGPTSGKNCHEWNPIPGFLSSGILAMELTKPSSELLFAGCVACGKPDLVASNTQYALKKPPACSLNCRRQIVSVLREMTTLVEWLGSSTAAVRFFDDHVAVDVADADFTTVSRFIGPVEKGSPPLTAWSNLLKALFTRARILGLQALEEHADRLRSTGEWKPKDQKQHAHWESLIQKDASSLRDNAISTADLAITIYGNGSLQSALLSETRQDGILPRSLNPLKFKLNERIVGILTAIGLGFEVWSESKEMILRKARSQVAARHPDRGGTGWDLSNATALLRQLKIELQLRHDLQDEYVFGLPGAFCYDRLTAPWFNPIPVSLSSTHPADEYGLGH